MARAGLHSARSYYFPRIWNAVLHVRSSADVHSWSSVVPIPHRGGRWWGRWGTELKAQSWMFNVLTQQIRPQAKSNPICI